MRELVYYVACSLDGFIAHLDGSHDGFSQDRDYLKDLFSTFPETVPSHLRTAMNIQAENQRFDTVLMGRKTYEIGLKEGVSSPYSHLKQYLFSTSFDSTPDSQVELISQHAVERVAALKSEPGKDIWLCGGATLAATLFAGDLVDTLILKMNPFLMGEGIPLFSGVVKQSELALSEQKSYQNGVLRLHYKIVR
ncbi:MAG: dihydrofolate reductase family protein [Phormidesmis sp.]